MKLYQLFFLLFLSATISAQDGKQTQWWIGYYGDVLVHPGVKLGYGESFKNWETTTPKHNKHKSLLLGGELMYYHQANHHHALILGPTIAYNRAKPNGRFIQWKWMSGVHQSLVDGLTYKISSADVITESRTAGQTSFYNSVSFLFGKKINPKISWYGEVGINGRYPYHHALLKGIHLSVGVRYAVFKDANR